MAVYKRTLLCLITVIASFLVIGLPKAFAENTASAAFSAPDSVSEGEVFSVKLTFTAGLDIGWFETNIVYDSKLVEYLSGDANGGDGTLHLRFFSDTPGKTLTSELSFKALKEGSADFSLVNCSVFTSDGVPIANPSASLSLTVCQSEDAPDSSRSSSETDSSSDSSEDDAISCTLKSLGVSCGELVPEFSPDIFDYTVKVPADVYKVEILTELASQEDFIWFECSSWLSQTDDPKQIIVNIYDGSVKVKITVKDKETDPTKENIYRIMLEPETSDDTSVAEDSTSSVNETSSQSAAVISESESSSDDPSSVPDRSSSSVAERSGMSELRDKLMPWLLVVLFVLVIALILVIYWIRSRTDRKRRKITTSSRKK